MFQSAHLEVEQKGRCAVLWITNPPTNILTAPIRKDLIDAILLLSTTSEIDYLILSSKERAFSTGADLRELSSVERTPGFQELFAIIEQCSIPVVAAIAGVALGAGVELMLACHERCATPPSIFGLPEVNLGVIPGAGGTQRLPRLIGALHAAEMILSAKSISANRAHAIGLIDCVIEGPFIEGVVAHIEQLGLTARRRRRTAELTVDPKGFDAPAIDAALERFALSGRPMSLGLAAIEAILGAITLPFEAGLARERQLAYEQLQTPLARQSLATSQR
jgi:3-hydroxyacyl-CoA dehydrogenase